MSGGPYFRNALSSKLPVAILCHFNRLINSVFYIYSRASQASPYLSCRSDHYIFFVKLYVAFSEIKEKINVCNTLVIIYNNVSI